MKPWHLVVAGLYVLILALLTPPILLAFHAAPDEIWEAYSAWGYWVFLAMLAACQLALLMVPVRVATRRPVSRGALWPTIVLCALMAALLGVGATVSLYGAILGDNDTTPDGLWCALALAVVLWGLWGVTFHRLSRTQAPIDFVGTVCSRLVRGSILELLVAVPCHIVVRYREFCCAGIYTMLGLAMGLAVMLFAFGPAVYFLFVARARRLQAGKTRPAEGPTAG